MSSARPQAQDDREMPAEAERQAALLARIQQYVESAERQAKEQKAVDLIKSQTKAIQANDAQSVAKILQAFDPNAKFHYGLKHKPCGTHVFVSNSSSTLTAEMHTTNETEVAAKLLVDVGTVAGNAMAELSLYRAMFQGVFQAAPASPMAPPAQQQSAAAAAPAAQQAAPQAPPALHIHIPASEEPSIHEPTSQSPSKPKM